MQSVVENVSLAKERYEIIKENVLKLNVYYDALSYTYIKETVKTMLVDLVSNLGGTLSMLKKI